MIGPPVSGKGDHRIVPYDPGWPDGAVTLIANLREALGDAVLRVEHVGSTAVPTLAARPIHDIQVSVRDIHDPDSFRPQLEAIGSSHFVFPELDVDDYYVFVPADGSNTEHVQVCEVGSHQERRHIAVRDYLALRPDQWVIGP